MERKSCALYPHRDCWCLKGLSPPHLQQAVLPLALGRPVNQSIDQARKEPPAYNDPTGTQRQEENLFDCFLVHLSLPLSDNFKTPKQHGPLASVSFHYKRFCFFPEVPRKILHLSGRQNAWSLLRNSNLHCMSLPELFTAASTGRGQLPGEATLSQQRTR